MTSENIEITEESRKTALKKRSNFMRIMFAEPVIVPHADGQKIMAALENAQKTTDNGWRDTTFEKVKELEAQDIVCSIVSEEKYIEAFTKALLTPNETLN